MRDMSAEFGALRRWGGVLAMSVSGEVVSGDGD